jgi:hypothetical protein
LSARTDDALLDKIGVKKTVFESAPEPYQASSHCVSVGAADAKMMSRHAHATQNRLLEVATDMI